MNNDTTSLQPTFLGYFGSRSSDVDDLFQIFELCTQALIDATSSGSDLEDESGIRMVALFDHEEVGSNSAQGAGSPVMIDAMSHITSCFSSDTKVANHSSDRH